MASWDIFHADRLELECDLSPEAVRAGIASGAIRPDDLARPARSNDPWVRVDARTDLIVPPDAGRPAGGGAETIGDDAGAFPPIGPEADRGRAGDFDPGPPARLGSETVEFEGLPSSYGETMDAPLLPGPSDDDQDDLGPLSRSDFDDDDLVELHVSGDHPDHEPEAPPTLDSPAGWAGSTFESIDDDDLGPDDLLDATNKLIDAEEQATIELRPSPPTPGPGPIPNPKPEPDHDDWDELVAAAGGSMPPVGPTGAGADPIDDLDEFDPIEEDEEAAAFTLAADPRADEDEIDLTAMVDVAFQLVLFFLVTATTLYFKTLEIPTPEPDDPDAVAQQMRTLDELLDEFILVEIDPQGRIEVDREPIAVDLLTDRLRQVRADTLRTGMLLMADFTTPHRNAVLAIDSANAVGLQVAIAKPTAPAE